MRRLSAQRYPLLTLFPGLARGGNRHPRECANMDPSPRTAEVASTNPIRRALHSFNWHPTTDETCGLPRKKFLGLGNNRSKPSADIYLRREIG